MAFSGKIFKEYTLPSGYHHDQFVMEDGNMAKSGVQTFSPHISVTLNTIMKDIIWSTPGVSVMRTVCPVKEYWLSDKYRAEKLPLYYANEVAELGEGEKLGQLIQTQTTRMKIKLPTQEKLYRSIYEAKIIEKEDRFNFNL